MPRQAASVSVLKSKRLKSRRFSIRHSDHALVIAMNEALKPNASDGFLAATLRYFVETGG